MPNANSILNDLAIRLHRLTRHTNIEADLDKRFSDPHPQFDPKIHVLPNWDELSMDTVDVELEFVREKWNGRLGQWNWERVKDWSVDVGKALEGAGDDESMETRSISERDTQRTDSTTEHSTDEANERSFPKVDTANKHERSESDGDVPVKRRRSEPRAAIGH
ncbi:uncharacterized protein ACHE_80726A [Aspergillus chevalieri]|uniref:Uncharacterized protein n=1 Tax=Aspergillus chevalieri TaxID=182096 RepID=A0A7R7ZTF8_ASPCH|nr:uncharacterized protein ACHE_80726A [Aspergillus chevalieri]BCR92826.1 hypothetical protein ACHE_80726A [Aspergillus chevalieri]